VRLLLSRFSLLTAVVFEDSLFSRRQLSAFAEILSDEIDLAGGVGRAPLGSRSGSPGRGASPSRSTESSRDLAAKNRTLPTMPQVRNMRCLQGPCAVVAGAPPADDLHLQE
jgi:hypothetical protein